MFSGCVSLKGEKGSSIENTLQTPRINYLDKSYMDERTKTFIDGYMAKIDAWDEGNPAQDSCGYLSRYQQVTPQPLVTVSDIILEFFNPILHLLPF